MALFSTPPRSICILRLSAIGDVCHAITVVQAIQRQWPTTEITWVAGKVEAQLINALPNIKVISFDKKAGWNGIKHVWQQLKSHRFDVLLDMQVALRASVLSLGIKAKYRVGFSKNRTKEGQWLVTNQHLPNTDSIHVLDNMADFARFIGVPFTTPEWNIPLTTADNSIAEQYIHQPTLVISPAASKDERNWLPERYAAIADYAATKGLTVILCGSPTEREQQLGQQIISHSQAAITNLIGKTTLLQLTALLRAATVVLAPDSGPAHLATTQNTPVIGLYGHSNPARTGPYLSQPYTVSVYQQVAEQHYGKPLGELPWGARVKGSDIMPQISVAMVKEKLDLILSLSSPMS
ncbi:glycosyltransferase family 9 protein [Photobacterium aquimaris]|uniref:Lipopolysaccharide heptosyltransferase family protein n=1 Tax=Photobacterium aquimaris TaxID=512643 RepID=A0A2T3I1R4_9GAMM|nr:glycosyltransferase family 9 protein [Photobacterium aquimaris]MCP4956468.1 glycosyltransferase family 9 protein [Photobacterium aquimaris]OBU16663.1 glycosyl transferase [Photobacterium aquimaris]PQJ37503.1 ADP-heptose--LPS heptosyltransferase I [Photobacterium aquimaris]PSU11900.1 lipopolysaccharide heptosyltransferase family protein [Photobacterium aquimaris]